MSEEVKELLCVARMQFGDIRYEGRVFSKVDLVVKCHDEAEGEGAQAAGQGRGVELSVKGVAKGG